MMTKLVQVNALSLLFRIPLPSLEHGWIRLNNDDESLFRNRVYYNKNLEKISKNF